MKPTLKLCAFASTVGYVALLPNFYMIFRAANRSDILWAPDLHAAILTAIAVIATLVGVAYIVFFKLWRPIGLLRYLRDSALTLLLAFLLIRTTVSILDRGGVLAAEPWNLLTTTEAKVVYYFLLPVPFILIRLGLVRRMIRRVYACIFPAVVFLVFWPLTYKSYDKSEFKLPDELTRAAGPSGEAKGPDVFIFLFDEWSYERTFPQGRLRTDLPRLAELLGTSTLYEQAYSEASRTGASIPRFLFQNNKSVMSLPLADIFSTVVNSRTFEGDSLFSIVPADWFKTAIGFWINYPVLLGKRVQFAARIHNEAAWRTYGRQVQMLLRSQCTWVRFLGFKFTLETDPPSVLLIHSEQTIESAAKSVIRNAPRPTMAFVHFCLPHYPYVWNQRGLKSDFPEDIDEHTVDGYLDNIRRMDTVLGEMMDELKKGGRWDRCLLIVTSDHAWRWDPAHPGYVPDVYDNDSRNAWRQVPLIIKKPRQTSGDVVSAVTMTGEIHDDILQELDKARSGVLTN